MVAGGSGITPLYQVIQAVLRDQPEDRTEMHLVYANRTEDDILLRGELDRWAAEHPDRLKVWYVVSRVKRPDNGWKYGVGFVTEAVLREHLPEGGDDDTRREQGRWRGGRAGLARWPGRRARRGNAGRGAARGKSRAARPEG